MKHNERMGGIYREPADPNAQALENMRKQIEAEGKTAIQIPEDFPFKSTSEPYSKAIQTGTKPSEIGLYCLKTGVLLYDPNPMYERHEKDYSNFYYRNTNPTQQIPDEMIPTIMVKIDKKNKKIELMILSTKK